MVDTVCTIYSISECLVEAERIGAKVINLNDNPIAKIKAATHRRGADFVMEIAGCTDALRLSLDLIRPWGQIRSIGVHTEKLEFMASCYMARTSHFRSVDAL
jgi:threonine dehydrogenase-like Zn-dependent dehydrogenase